MPWNPTNQPTASNKNFGHVTIRRIKVNWWFFQEYWWEVKMSSLILNLNLFHWLCPTLHTTCMHLIVIICKALLICCNILKCCFTKQLLFIASKVWRVVITHGIILYSNDSIKHLWPSYCTPTVPFECCGMIKIQINSKSVAINVQLQKLWIKISKIILRILPWYFRTTFVAAQGVIHYLWDFQVFFYNLMSEMLAVKYFI